MALSSFYVSQLSDPMLFISLSLSSIYTHFNTSKKKSLGKTLWKKVKLLKMSNFTFFHNAFYTIYILKSFNSHISVVVCCFFEFGIVSKWCIVETTDSGERGMNPVAMTIINSRKEYWPSRGSNQRPPVLKSTTLPAELWDSTGENTGY